MPVADTIRSKMADGAPAAVDTMLSILLNPPFPVSTSVVAPFPKNTVNTTSLAFVVVTPLLNGGPVGLLCAVASTSLEVATPMYSTK